MRIVSVVGARPNFVKIAPIARALRTQSGVDHVLIHTGQHYDRSMSDSFFETLEIPEPDINLGVGSSSHGVQTGRIMIELEPVLEELAPDWVVTVGDVNSTAAAALVACKLQRRVVHVEAGLRSFDRSMPEEINRVITDAVSDLLFVTEQSGRDNLAREGIDPGRVHLVGNVMIDSLVRALPSAREAEAWKRYRLSPGEYVLVTLHRPSNVDDPEMLRGIVEALIETAAAQPVLFPVHPRTRRSLERFDLFDRLAGAGGVTVTEPLDYRSFLSLTTAAKGLLTDSGGIQEETTHLGIPCLTLRANTERPVTIELGTNALIGSDLPALREALAALERGEWKRGERPPLWDGNTAERIAAVLLAAHG